MWPAYVFLRVAHFDALSLKKKIKCYKDGLLSLKLRKGANVI